MSQPLQGIKRWIQFYCFTFLCINTRCQVKNPVNKSSLPTISKCTPTFLTLMPRPLSNLISTAFNNGSRLGKMNISQEKFNLFKLTRSRNYSQHFFENQPMKHIDSAKDLGILHVPQSHSLYRCWREAASCPYPPKFFLQRCCNPHTSIRGLRQNTQRKFGLPHL